MSSLNNRRSKPNIKVEVMAKIDMAATTSTTTIPNTTSPNQTNNSSPENSLKNEKKKRLIPRIFGSKRNGGRGSSDEDSLKSDGDNGFDFDLDQKISSRRNELMETAPPIRRKTFSERSGTSSNIESLNLSNFEQSPANEIKEFRIFVATWNVGGRAPDNGLNLEDFLQIEGASDIYIIGFQEIVPLSAGNVLGSEDNEPAAKWLLLIEQALNKPHHESAYSSDLSGNIGSKISNNSRDSKDSKPIIFQKSNLKQLSKSLRADKTLLKSCNCPVELPISQEKRWLTKLGDPSNNKLHNLGSPPARRNVDMDEFLAVAEIPFSSPNQMPYRLIASKQMVGIFLTVWTQKDLVPHIGHLRFSSVGRGIMGYLGNKGCISISMTLHKTTFCFVCSHLASGEKEGHELKRNADVAEILKSTQFSKICKTRQCQRAPEKIIDHDRVIWLGDLNYRMALSYEETLVLLDDNSWDTLLQKDQLNLEREAGRVFSGFNEGRILFAPTYKYSQNSDSYAGENVKSKKKRRTPAWCDRILWRGAGIEQLSYVRGELRFSDHRPVCAVFAVEAEVRSRNNRFRKGYSCAAPRRIYYDDCIPQRHSLYDF